MIQLRPYQHDAVTAIVKALHEGQRRQLVVMPTGTGKTVVFVHPTRSWHDDEPTEKQFGLLAKLGINVEAATKGEANHLIEAGLNRHGPNHATDKQRAFLRRRGVNVSTMARSQAGAIIGRIKSRSRRRVS